MSNLKKQKAISLGIVIFCMAIGTAILVSAAPWKQSPIQTRGYQFYFTPEQTQTMIKGLELLSIKEAADTYGSAMAQIQQQNAAAQQAQQKPVVKDTLTNKKH